MMTPIRITKSSHIKAAAYDPLSKTLALSFEADRVYHFVDVPADVVDQLQKAKSPGAYFAKNIRDDYDFTIAEVSVAEASLATPAIPDKPPADTVVHVIVGIGLVGQPVSALIHLEVHADPVIAARRCAALAPGFPGTLTVRAAKVIG